MSTSIDPVCGMNVDEANGLTATFRDREYHFCSEECLHRFESEPERYVESAA